MPLRVAALAFCLLPLLVAAPVFAHDRVSITEAQSSYIAARQAEGQGSIVSAQRGYMAALKYGMQATTNPAEYKTIKVGGESLSEIGRRATALQAKIVDDLLSKGGAGLKSQQAELQNLYRTMATLEPTNPNWWYLYAIMIANREHHYPKARYMLKKCVACPGGSAAVKSRARKLIAHINAAADQQQKWLNVDIAKSKQRFKKFLESGAAFSGGVPSGSSSSSSGSSDSSMPDWERRAREAESRGDYGAADRFRSGGASGADSARYW